MILPPLLDGGMCLGHFFSVNYEISSFTNSTLHETTSCMNCIHVLTPTLGIPVVQLMENLSDNVAFDLQLVF